jgi:hypothetical protein
MVGVLNKKPVGFNTTPLCRTKPSIKISINQVTSTIKRNFYERKN